MPGVIVIWLKPYVSGVHVVSVIALLPQGKKAFGDDGVRVRSIARE
jgi:hypothetical protein